MTTSTSTSTTGTSTPGSSTPAAPRSPLRTALLIGGSVAIVALLAFLVVAVVSAANRADASREVTIDTSFDTLAITSEVADVRVSFGDVAKATVAFEQRGANRNMSFEAETAGATLTVAVAEHGSAPFFFGDVGASPRLVVTLPASIAGRGLDLTLDADIGDVVLDGEFGEVDVVTTVGDLRLSGSAERVDLETTVGEVTLDDADIAGDVVIGTTTGSAGVRLAAVPGRLDVVTTVGDIDLSLPSGEYRIDTSTNIGDVEVNVPDSPGADTIVRAETTTGDITISD